MEQPHTEAPHEDLRQRRTKKFLVTALVALMDERPFSEISVVDICERAMVHRTTFYAHFEDKYALLRYAVAEIYRTFEPHSRNVTAGSPSQTYFMTIFQNALIFMREHRGLYRSTTSSNGMDLQILEELVAAELAVHFSDTALPPADPPLSAEITAHFYAGAILSVLRWWLENDMPVSDEVLISHAERLIFHAG